MSLFDPELPVEIILVDSTRHITVCIDADEEDREFFPEICSQVRETVLGALEKVLDVMRLTEIQVSAAVLCPCKESSEAHCASHFKLMTKYFLRCSKTNAHVGRAQEEHMMWRCSDKQSPPRNESSESLSLPMLMKLGIPEQVSTGFKKFGTLLLNDATGVQVNSIDDELRGNHERTATRILEEWLKGKGLPVTLDSLLDTLRACNLNTLADRVSMSLRAQK